jgi:hypothetical protein
VVRWNGTGAVRCVGGAEMAAVSDASSVGSSSDAWSGRGWPSTGSGNGRLTSRDVTRVRSPTASGGVCGRTGSSGEPASGSSPTRRGRSVRRGGSVDRRSTKVTVGGSGGVGDSRDAGTGVRTGSGPRGGGRVRFPPGGSKRAARAPPRSSGKRNGSGSAALSGAAARATLGSARTTTALPDRSQPASKPHPITSSPTDNRFAMMDNSPWDGRQPIRLTAPAIPGSASPACPPWAAPSCPSPA